jgi:hypothetical protein
MRLGSAGGCGHAYLSAGRGALRRSRRSAGDRHREWRGGCSRTRAAFRDRTVTNSSAVGLDRPQLPPPSPRLGLAPATLRGEHHHHHHRPTHARQQGSNNRPTAHNQGGPRPLPAITLRSTGQTPHTHIPSHPPPPTPLAPRRPRTLGPSRTLTKMRRSAPPGAAQSARALARAHAAAGRPPAPWQPAAPRPSARCKGVKRRGVHAQTEAPRRVHSGGKAPRGGAGRVNV